MLTGAQVLVPSGSAVLLVTVPPGYQAALSVLSGTIYVGGGGTAVTTSTGGPVTGYALLPGVPVTASPSPLFAVAGAGGGTVTCGVFLAGPR
jgi:hypothetical protein